MIRHDVNGYIDLNARAPLFALLVAAAWPCSAQEELPLWEAGLGIGVVSAPHYRGSDERRAYVLPIPYFIYRGERLRLDRRGLRNELFEGTSASIDFSASLGLPARSQGNDARAGMPDLDPTLEIGPSFNVRLYENAPRDRLLTLRMPLRAVIATDLSSANYIGWVFLPHLAYDLRNVRDGWNIGLSAGPIFAANRYHDYYYAVPSEFATPTRPAYDAGAGYSGFSTGIVFSRRYPGYWFGTFIRYDNLHGAVFDNSPLVRQSYAVIAGIAVSKIVARSERTVGTEEPETRP